MFFFQALKSHLIIFVNVSAFTSDLYNKMCFSELSKWLEPLEKLHFDISGIPTLIDYIKQVRLSTT